MPIPSHLPELRPQRSSPDFRRRSWALAGMAILTSAVYLMNLMSIQIVNGETYYQQSLSTTLSVIPIQAARGEIYDAEGEKLAGNRTGMNIVFHYAVWKSDGLEERLSILMQLCEERGESWYDPLPINEDGTAFTEDSLSEQQGNILTVNQNIPVDGVAAVSVSARLPLPMDLEQLRQNLLSLPGVTQVDILSTR